MSPSPDDPPAQDTLARTKEIEHAIGSVCAAWAKLETSLAALLGLLLHADPVRGRIVYDSISTHRGRMELISRLIVTFIDKQELKDQWARLQRRCKKFSSKRNMIVHSWSVFFTHEDKIAFVTTVFPKDLGGAFSTEYNLLRTKSILGISGSIRALDAELLLFVLNLREYVRETPTECHELYNRQIQ